MRRIAPSFALALAFLLALPLAAQQKPDALLIYRQGRELEVAGKTAESQAKYAEAVGVCDTELAADPKRMDAYAVKCWSLFRLGRHQEVVGTGAAALKVQFDARVAEVMGESYYHLGQMENALKYLGKYLENAADNADRVPTAYFYIGETYLRLKKYAHTDIAYTTAVAKEPSMPRWWYRLGQACESQGEWKRAYDAYAKAVALNPSMAEAIDGRDRVKPKAGL